MGPIGREVVENYCTTAAYIRVVHLVFSRTGSSRKLYSLQLDPEFDDFHLWSFWTGSSRIFGSELYSMDFRSGTGFWPGFWAGFTGSGAGRPGPVRRGHFRGF